MPRRAASSDAFPPRQAGSERAGRARRSPAAADAWLAAAGHPYPGAQKAPVTLTPARRKRRSLLPRRAESAGRPYPGAQKAPVTLTPAHRKHARCAGAAGGAGRRSRERGAARPGARPVPPRPYRRCRAGQHASLQRCAFRPTPGVAAELKRQLSSHHGSRWTRTPGPHRRCLAGLHPSRRELQEGGAGAARAGAARPRERPAPGRRVPGEPDLHLIWGSAGVCPESPAGVFLGRRFGAGSCCRPSSPAATPAAHQTPASV
jgi:hypothetical protein